MAVLRGAHNGLGSYDAVFCLLFICLFDDADGGCLDVEIREQLVHLQGTCLYAESPGQGRSELMWNR
jgi:hypothetical protein